LTNGTAQHAPDQMSPDRLLFGGLGFVALVLSSTWDDLGLLGVLGKWRYGIGMNAFVHLLSSTSRLPIRVRTIARPETSEVVTAVNGTDGQKVTNMDYLSICTQARRSLPRLPTRHGATGRGLRQRLGDIWHGMGD
jgi:hypothetical protein